MEKVMNENKKNRVLLAEDDEGYSFPIQRALERAGFEVTLVDNEEGVLEHGLHSQALVIDVRLPTGENEGLRAAAKLVGKGLTKDVPLLFVSVLDELDPAVQSGIEVLQSKDRDFEWYTKPIEPVYLAKAVQKMLEDRK
jgi:CheY-like chemotaxis protein